MKILFTTILISISPVPSLDGWEIFGKVRFSERYFKALDAYYLAPFFDSKIKSFEGEEITLKGHYLPMDLEDPNVIVLSKFPFSMCFFCGGAGPESVAEIYFSTKRPRLKADQIITVKGKLKLNASDVNHMNFILTDAIVIPE